LKPCLESIINTTDLTTTEIIVVANGCGDDGTKEFVESLGESFKLMWFSESLGYTKSTNEGIKTSKGDYVILLNNDCIIYNWYGKNVWINMLEKPFLDDSKMAITGVLKGWDYNANFEHIIFFCVMIKKTMFEELGLLDEIFNPGAGEDADFCMKAKLAGYKFVTVPIDNIPYDGCTAFPIYHAGGSTFKDVKDRTFVDENNKILAARYKGKNDRSI
jgi:GT2 family glycosyltransferase